MLVLFVAAGSEKAAIAPTKIKSVKAIAAAIILNFARTLSYNVLGVSPMHKRLPHKAYTLSFNQKSQFTLQREQRHK
ncbi:MAG: hypothetical protein RMX35_00395 [Nostoc sp. DcaGUA01]|nr:hypothetical protein [Nostoc sp. DcaGUA01]